MVEDYKDRLEKAMTNAGVSITALGVALDVSYQAIKKVIEGKSSAFNAFNNSKAARFLGVNPDWLATGEGLMKRDVAHADHWRMVADALATELNSSRVDAAAFLVLTDLLAQTIPVSAPGSEIASTAKRHLRLVA